MEKNTNEKEIALNDKLIKIIQKMPSLYKGSGNSFRRSKLHAFIVLSQMNEFKEYIKNDYDMSKLDT